MPGVQREIVDSFADLFPACEGQSICYSACAQGPMLKLPRVCGVCV